MKKKLFLFSYSLLSDYIQRVQTVNPVKYSIKISSVETPTSFKGIRDKNYKIGRLIKMALLTLTSLGFFTLNNLSEKNLPFPP